MIKITSIETEEGYESTCEITGSSREILADFESLFETLHEHPKFSLLFDIVSKAWGARN